MFQQREKIGDDVVDLWAAILSDIPESKLYLKSSQFNEPSFVERMRLRFENRRISYERLMLEGSSPRKEYLNAYNKIDITLDTFPFSGATTTVESLWMGVPTLTMPGSTNVSRQSASMMAAVGLKDWIASSEDEYLTKARSFSRDTRYMSALRSTLRETLRESPLLNAKKFAVDFEHLICSAHQERINLSPKVTLISN